MNEDSIVDHVAVLSCGPTASRCAASLRCLLLYSDGPQILQWRVAFLPCPEQELEVPRVWAGAVHLWRHVFEPRLRAVLSACSRRHVCVLRGCHDSSLLNCFRFAHRIEGV